MQISFQWQVLKGLVEELKESKATAQNLEAELLEEKRRTESRDAEIERIKQEHAQEVARLKADSRNSHANWQAAETRATAQAQSPPPASQT